MAYNNILKKKLQIRLYYNLYSRKNNFEKIKTNYKVFETFYSIENISYVLSFVFSRDYMLWDILSPSYLTLRSIFAELVWRQCVYDKSGQVEAEIQSHNFPELNFSYS